MLGGDHDARQIDDNGVNKELKFRRGSREILMMEIFPCTGKIVRGRLADPGAQPYINRNTTLCPYFLHHQHLMSETWEEWLE